jgi:type IV pilus assembly protein PilY1
MRKVYTGALLVCLFFFSCSLLFAITISDVPLFVTQSVEPRVMLVMSNDHQLYIKAYTDYSDLNGDGELDTTYNDEIDYYGYFGVNNCYTYSSTDGRFNPTGTAGGTNSHHCGAMEWSGNFLNWATMTRMDVIRKVLYGGYRSTDDTTTVLERVLLPYDVHSFVKVFSTDSTTEMQNFVPYAETEVSICNVTYVTSGVSRSITEAPHMRIASGSWPLWASAEVTQCTWGSGVRPSESTDKLDELTARVSVCESGYEEDNCQTYPNGNVKPVGLLQEYSEGTQNAPLRFGLMTGSYQKNLSGGVLRRNIEPIVGNTTATQNEIDLDSGIFLNQGATDVGIINTLNRLRISSYDYGSKKYGSSCGSPGIMTISDGTCVEWGNPLNELYLEALRYYSGKTSPTSAFNANDSTYISSLPQVTWSDPIPSTDWCADCSLVVISTGLNSFDTDQLSNDIAGVDADALTNEVGVYEGISTSTTLLVGESDTDTDKRCTAKTVSGLSEVKGICPEVPSMGGGYHIAGLAYYARTNDLRSDRQGETKPMTYTVALAESLPRFEIPVGDGTVTILPACEANSDEKADENSSGWRICSLTDLVVESLTYSGNAIAAGQLQISWEDSTWGNDYDMDGISRLEFCVGSACNICVCQDYCDTSGCITCVGDECDVCDVSPCDVCDEDKCDDCNASDECYIKPSICEGSKPLICEDNECTDSETCVIVEDKTICDAVEDNQILIKSSVQQANAGHALRFGYTITGSTDDRMHLPILRPGDKNFSIGQDLPDGVTNATTHQHTVGESAAQLLENPLWYTAKYGGFIDQNDNDWPDLDEEWSTNATGVPDTYFKATNPADLFEALGTVFENVVKTSSSAASVVANSVRLDTGTYVYQARFRTNDWSGELLAYPVQMDGSIDEADWEAGMKLPDHGARNIYTINTAADPQGVAFEWANLNATQNTSIADNATDGQAIINYIRGDQSQELQNGGAFRDRERLLGDIINSDPVFVGAANFGYNVDTIPEGFTDDPLVEGAYNQYLAKIKDRTRMIYLGANDGMLHGFRAEDGVELFAYIPNAVIPQLQLLTEQNYVDNHKYFVDGPPRVGDAYIDADGFGEDWRTILVGSTGAGGKSVFAIDVTNPDSDAVLDDIPAFSGENILWEFTHADLGYTIGQPTIARLVTGDWVAIFGNGYNSTNDRAKLFIVNLETGALLLDPFDTEVGSSGSPNGMATAIPVDTDGDRITDYVYAGDMLGNMWKLDLTDSSIDKWDFAFIEKISGTNYPRPLFTAKDRNGDAQPITSRPVVSAHPDGGYMVYFGTGRFFAENDDNVSMLTTHDTFYGIYDLDESDEWITETDRSILQQQEITYEAIHENIDFNYPVRVTTQRTVNYTDNSDPTNNPIRRGWYIDLIKPDESTGTLQGERVISPPLLRSGRIIFNTLIPSSEPCDFGGKTWLMELDAVTGGRLDFSPFDFNGDDIFNTDDYVTVPDPDPEDDSGAEEEIPVPVTGIQLDVGIAKTPAVISGGDKEYKYFSGSSGDMQVVTENPGDASVTGRQSWRQLR